MNQEKLIWTPKEIADAVPCAYATVLADLKKDALPSQMAGGSYIIYSYHATDYIKRRQAQADPQIVEKLQQRIGQLELELETLRAKVGAV